MTLVDTLIREINALRADIRDLKRCQVQYFTLSITGTGGILGLAGILKGPTLEGAVLLAPLAIILPCWLIFFDKATTITRIVGYQRVLEQLLRDPPQEKYSHIGYENALAKFRAEEHKAWAEIRQSNPTPNVFALLLLRTRHRYWIVNWYTFAILSWVCWVGAFSRRTGGSFEFHLPLGIRLAGPEVTLWVGAAFLMVAMCSVYTFTVIVSLIRGRLSYDACAAIWNKILLGRE